MLGLHGAQRPFRTGGLQVVEEIAKEDDDESQDAKTDDESDVVEDSDADDTAGPLDLAVIPERPKLEGWEEGLSPRTCGQREHS